MDGGGDDGWMAGDDGEADGDGDGDGGDDVDCGDDSGDVCKRLF